MNPKDLAKHLSESMANLDQELRKISTCPTCSKPTAGLVLTGQTKETAGLCICSPQALDPDPQPDLITEKGQNGDAPQADPRPDPAQILQDLPHFTGTEKWHRWSILFPVYYLTDGAKYLADTCRAYWLMDAIASWQKEIFKKHGRQEFQVWDLTVRIKPETGARYAVLVCGDGNGNRLALQKIEYTDFPLDKIRLYFTDGIILLPSEY